jgi:hypothetical protein
MHHPVYHSLVVVRCTARCAAECCPATLVVSPNMFWRTWVTISEVDIVQGELAKVYTCNCAKVLYTLIWDLR